MMNRRNKKTLSQVMDACFGDDFRKKIEQDACDIVGRACNTHFEFVDQPWGRVVQEYDWNERHFVQH